jgi:hypothetical protein
VHPQLEAIEREFSAGMARFGRLSSAISDEDWAVRVRADAWSVAECIVHLNLSAEAMLPRLRTAVEEARALGSVPVRRYRPTMFGRMLAKMVGPAPGVGRFRLGRVKTGARFVPPAALAPREQIEREFLRLHEAIIAALHSADDVALDRVTVPSPFMEGARYDGYSAFLIVARHMHRHLAQAERVWV